MTDGMLLRELLVDGDMKLYAVVMLDEAHERTIYCSRRLVENFDAFTKYMLKYVAALGSEETPRLETDRHISHSRCSSYFYEAPIFTIPGRTHPVDILYTKEAETDYLDAALISPNPQGTSLFFFSRGKRRLIQSVRFSISE